MPISTGVRGSPCLVHRVPEPGHEAAGVALVRRTASRASGVPACVVGPGRSSPRSTTTACRNAAAVLGDAEEARPAAEQPGGERALQRVGRGQVGQPGGDRGRGEAVVGQRDEHRLEDPGLAGRRAPLRDQPEGQLAEADLAHQVGGEVLAEQRDLVGAGGAERRREGRHPSGSSSVVAVTGRRRRASARAGEPAPDLVAVLVEARAAAAGSRAGSREPDRVAHRGHRGVALADVHDRVEADRSAKATPPSTVLIGPHGTPAAMMIVEPLHRGAGGAAARRAAAAARRGWRCGPRCARSAGRRPAPGTPSTSHELAELAVVAGGDDQVAVGGTAAARRGTGSGGVAHPEGDDAAGDVRAGLVDQPRQRRGQQVDLDVLAAPGRVRGGCSAARMPMVACRPAITSNTEMPAR